MPSMSIAMSLRGQLVSSARFLGPDLLNQSSWVMVAAGASIATNSPPGTIFLSCDGTNIASAEQSVTTVVGVTYKITLTTGTGTIVALRISDFQGGANLLNVNISPSTVGYSNTFVATSTTTWIKLQRSGSGVCNINTISLKN